MLAGVGLSASLGENLRIFADYDALVDSDRFQHELTVNARIRF